MIPHRAIFKRPNLGSERPDFRSGRLEVPDLGSQRPKVILKGLNWGLRGLNLSLGGFC